jgi:hypothetical protein
MSGTTAEGFNINFYGSLDRERDNETNQTVIDIQKYLNAGYRIYPKFAAPVLISSGGTSYVEGGAVEMVPPGTILTEWAIKQVFIVELSKLNEEYIFTFYDADSNDILCEAIGTRNATACYNISTTNSIAIPGGAGVNVKIATSGAGINSANIKILYILTGRE